MAVHPVVLACALLAGCARDAATPSPAPSPGKVERDVVLREGTIHLVVEHDGDDAWARYVADRASAYLPAAERYLDVPFHEAAAGMFHDLPRPWAIRIVGRETVMLGDVHIGAYNNTYGVFGPDRAIFVEYRLARRGDPALVLHELTHDWFHGRRAALAPGSKPDDSSPAWLVEGLASMTPIAVVEAGLLPLPAGEDRAMRRHWGQWAVPPASTDVAIQHDPRREGGIAIFYGKSYRVQLVIERLLGAQAYRALLERLARDLPATNDGALELLHAQAVELDWRGTLSGWIFPGPYRRFQPADVPRFMP